MTLFNKILLTLSIGLPVLQMQGWLFIVAIIVAGIDFVLTYGFKHLNQVDQITQKDTYLTILSTTLIIQIIIILSCCWIYFN